MKDRRSGKFEFSFSFAVGAALVLHVLAALILKYNVVIATPIRSNLQPPPVTMRFVEVPPNSPTVRETPRTNNISDANRIASPPPGKRQTVPGNRAQPSNSVARSASPTAQARPQEAQQEPLSDLKPDRSEEGVRVSENPENLSTSLRNLDKYIGGGEGAGEGGGQPQPGSGSGVLFDTKGHDLGPWGNQVVAIVRSNWIIPVAAELGLKGVVGISFQVDRQGNIGGLALVSQSGIPSFDQAAVNALKSSSPLPPLPTYYPEPVITAIFRFYYNTPVPP